MIALFTDFGSQDSYVGQMHAVLAQHAPGVPVVDLFHHVPNFDIRAGAYLLPGYVTSFPEGAVFVCVVDPGVGSSRRSVYIKADGCWFVGPDNGLFQLVIRRARQCECFVIDWRPDVLSASFHGRDLYAPVAAMLVRGLSPDATPVILKSGIGAQWTDELAEVVYIDHFGNAITGYRASSLTKDAEILVNNKLLKSADTFSDVPTDSAFWYENANGLVEIAVNQGSASEQLAITPGMAFTIQS